jgi:hypothetical protein
VLGAHKSTTERRNRAQDISDYDSGRLGSGSPAAFPEGPRWENSKGARVDKSTKRISNQITLTDMTDNFPKLLCTVYIHIFIVLYGLSVICHNDPETLILYGLQT